MIKVIGFFFTRIFIQLNPELSKLSLYNIIHNKNEHAIRYTPPPDSFSIPTVKYLKEIKKTLIWTDYKIPTPTAYVSTWVHPSFVGVVCVAHLFSWCVVVLV